MRKVIAMLLLMSLLLVGCGKGGGKDKTDTGSPSGDITASDNSSSDENDFSDIDDDFSDFEDDNYDDFGWDDDFYFNGSLNGSVTYTKKDGVTSVNPVYLGSQKGGYDKAAAAMRNKILNSEGKYNITGTTYYISPNGDDFDLGTSPDTAWQTLDALVLNDYLIEPGDAILFERGGVFRQNSSIIVANSGLTFGAYGKGAKPCIYGSPVDYADASIWESSQKKNIWKMEFPQTDAGIMVFNFGEFAGEKKAGLAAMAKNGDFYHNLSDKTIYVYCDSGNPGNVFKNIEIGTNQFIMSIYGGVHDILIDNICFRYTGAHGIDAFENNYDITITNCEFGWMGGSIQEGVTRYGNAIQFWDSCWDINVSNNWIYQVYDAGLTFQFAISASGGGYYHDIDFSDNLIEYCSYSIEIFTSSTDGTLKNINIDSNVMRFAGYGLGTQRPNSLNVSHICGWSVNYGDAVENFVIKNNVFDCSTTQAVDWASGDTAHKGFKVSGNTFYEKAFAGNPVMNFGTAGYTYAKNQSELEKAIKTFDPSPKLIKWLG